MFTIDQIKEAHAKVRSGEDFPAYVKDLTKLGVVHYDTYVYDGHTHFVGKDAYQISTPAKYPDIPVKERADAKQFAEYLRQHQQGQSDYPLFCKQAAETGVDKWSVDMKQMTCTYYDQRGNKLLTEQIPKALTETTPE